MRVAFFYPYSSIGRPIDPGAIWTSPRGLTGSELAFVMYAKGLAALGHGVTVFTRVTGPAFADGMSWCPYEEWETTYRHQDWDSMCSWMTPEPLASPARGAFRLFNQQVSDFRMCPSGWEAHVDLLAPLSSSHARYLVGMTSLPRSRWRVMYNGVDLDTFRRGEKVPGRMIWASSHDRGLHWLLEAFPEVRRRIPAAELHIFYDFAGCEAFASRPEDPNNHLAAELTRRSVYTLDALKRLSGRGVHVHGSASRERMAVEMAAAQVLPYPCDPVHYTETFGVTVLEACASGTVPVICSADAFGELWAPFVPHVPPPFSSNKRAYVDVLCRVLGDRETWEVESGRCERRAAEFGWPRLVLGLEKCLLTRGAEGLPGVDWL